MVTRLLLLLGSCVPFLTAQDLVSFVFLEPVNAVDTRAAEIAENMPLLRKVADASKYTPWLKNESAERAVRLYRAAYDIVKPGAGTPNYYIALVPGGNHAAVGFKLQTESGVEEHTNEPFILLDAQPYRFDNTLLHETGHMAMALVAGGRRLEGKQMASIPHSTAALSDRVTAFQEGYAIHLETLEAHVGKDPNLRARYQHGSVIFDDASEYFRGASDLMSYSQSVARYGEVRDNSFSFESAFQGPDYLRVQLEKARDFSTLRDANQLLQSEGFYASFFFLWAVRGRGTPAEEVVMARERQMLDAMHTMFAAARDGDGQPWLVRLAVEYMKRFPAEKTEMIDAINDLSHGVFVDPEAAKIWKSHYLAALRLDQKNLNTQAIGAKWKGWREQVAANPEALLSRVGPEIACEVPAVKVLLVAFGEDAPLRFDVNTAQTGVLRLIPGITEEQVAKWIGARPFASAEDFRKRGLVLAGMEVGR